MPEVLNNENVDLEYIFLFLATVFIGSNYARDDSEKDILIRIISIAIVVFLVSFIVGISVLSSILCFIFLIGGTFEYLLIKKIYVYYFRILNILLASIFISHMPNIPITLETRFDINIIILALLFFGSGLFGIAAVMFKLNGLRFSHWRDLRGEFIFILGGGLAFLSARNELLTILVDVPGYLPNFLDRYRLAVYGSGFVTMIISFVLVKDRKLQFQLSTQELLIGTLGSMLSSFILNYFYIQYILVEQFYVSDLYISFSIGVSIINAIQALSCIRHNYFTTRLAAIFLNIFVTTFTLYFFQEVGIAVLSGNISAFVYYYKDQRSKL